MKKYIWGLFIVIILSISGYFVYQNYFKKTEYYISYYELTKKDVKELQKHGEIKSTFKGENKTKVDNAMIQGDVHVFFKGNKEKREEIVDRIKQNKNVYKVYEVDKMEGDRIQ